jgi:hypothetical protein
VLSSQGGLFWKMLWRKGCRRGASSKTAAAARRALCRRPWTSCLRGVRGAQRRYKVARAAPPHARAAAHAKSARALITASFCRDAAMATLAPPPQLADSRKRCWSPDATHSRWALHGDGDGFAAAAQAEAEERRWRERCRGASDGDANAAPRHGSVNREEGARSHEWEYSEEGDDEEAHTQHTPQQQQRRTSQPQRSRWSWPAGDAADADAHAHADYDDSGSDERGGMPLSIPCCRAWRACDAAGACVHSARVLRRIHDEDGAAVDVVTTTQFLPAGGPGAVVYKTYDAADNACLAYLVQTEARYACACVWRLRAQGFLETRKRTEKRASTRTHARTCCLLTRAVFPLPFSFSSLRAA